MRSRVELFEQIRRDREFAGMSTHALARKYGVHRRTVRQRHPRADQILPSSDQRPQRLGLIAVGSRIRKRCLSVGASSHSTNRATLQMMVKQITEIESEISQALDGHPDGEIFRRESVICVVGRPVISSFTIIP